MILRRGLSQAFWRDHRASSSITFGWFGSGRDSGCYSPKTFSWKRDGAIRTAFSSPSSPTKNHFTSSPMGVAVLLDEQTINSKLVVECFSTAADALQKLPDEKEKIVYILPQFFPCSYSVRTTNRRFTPPLPSHSSSPRKPSLSSTRPCINGLCSAIGRSLCGSSPTQKRFLEVTIRLYSPRVKHYRSHPW